MQFTRKAIGIFALGVTLTPAGKMAAFQTSHPRITVAELPPEAVPKGICAESHSGYLGFEKHGKEETTHLTPRQLGDYVWNRLHEGYTVALYPQVSGKIFAIAKCPR